MNGRGEQVYPTDTRSLTSFLSRHFVFHLIPDADVALTRAPMPRVSNWNFSARNTAASLVSRVLLARSHMSARRNKENGEKTVRFLPERRMEHCFETKYARTRCAGRS